MRLNWGVQVEGGGTLEDWLKANYSGCTNTELADEIERQIGWRPKERALTDKARLLGLSKGRSTLDLGDEAKRIPVSSWKRYDRAPRLTGDVVVLSDCQVPFHDAAFMDRVVDLAVVWGIKTCVLAGDFVDLAAYSPFGKDAELFAEQEFRQAEAVLSVLGSRFERVVWLFGNHEDRLRRMLNRDLAVSRFLRLFTRLENVEITGYYYCFVGEQWIVCHPANASVIGARTPQWLAEKYGRHVAGGHGHLWGAMWDRSGTRLGVDVGICADPLRLEYAAVRLSTRPAMVQGALILRNEKPWLLHPALTDWERLKALGGES